MKVDWTPFGNPSLLTRIAIAKSIGGVVGVIGFFVAPMIHPEIEMLTRIGLLFWYPTLGAFVGLFGVMNWHPIVHIALPWWFRSVFIGAWMNFVLVFFAHDAMSDLLTVVIGPGTSAFWFVLVGGLVGGVMGYTATRFGGEGPPTVELIAH